MIRICDRIIEDYFIDPVTAVITDKDGIIQKTRIYKDGRQYFKGCAVFRIQMHTWKGYRPNMDIHHIDEDKRNDALSNLIYLTPNEHSLIHNKGRRSGADNHAFGKHWKLTDEQRSHQSQGQKRYYANLTEEQKMNRRCNSKGWHHTEETKKKLSKLIKDNSYMRGKHLSEHQKEEIAQANIGKHFWNDGKTCIRSKECPGDGWIKGMLHYQRHK